MFRFVRDRDRETSDLIGGVYRLSSVSDILTVAMNGQMEIGSKGKEWIKRVKKTNINTCEFLQINF